MSIGLCCQLIEEQVQKNGVIKYNNLLNEKHLQLGRFEKKEYSLDRILETYISNTSNLLKCLHTINSLGIKSFRISSNLLPLFEKVDRSILENKTLIENLAKIGKFAVEHNIRLTSHPDQFCVISSKKKEVIQNSFKILEEHAWIMDKMNLPHSNYYAINIHGGPRDQFSTLVDSINTLSNNVKSRLTLENDEISYSVQDLYQVHKETGIPIVYDSHHSKFNNGKLSCEDAMNMAISTWKVKPLTHLSNTEPGMENGSFQDRRKHSNYVHYIPKHQLEANNLDKIDIDFEFKMKNLAILKAVKDFDIKL